MKVKTDLAPLLKTLAGLTDPDEIAPIIEGLTDEVYEECCGRALRLGSRIGPRIRRSLSCRYSGLEGEVLASGADGYIGLHIHQGGPVRSRNGKILAIPTKWNPHKNKEIFARNYPEELQVIKSKRKNRAYLFKKLLTPGEVLGRPLYVLTPRTRPQKPRPWWPDSKDLDTLAEKFIRENL